MTKKSPSQRLPKNVLEKASVPKTATPVRRGPKENPVKAKVIAALKRLHPMD